MGSNFGVNKATVKPDPVFDLNQSQALGVTTPVLRGTKGVILALVECGYVSGATKSKLVQALGPGVVVRRGGVPRPRGPF